MSTFSDIIENGCCIGCGACTAGLDGEIRIELDCFGRYHPIFIDQNVETDRALSICPFSDVGPHEDELGDTLYQGQDAERSLKLGFYRSLFVGHVGESSFREKGTSGGVISWLLTETLAKGLADHVIHVKKADRRKDGCLFRYGISSTPEAVLEGAKSRYYPVEMSEVIQQVYSTPGRYVFVGLPCFVKAVRRLMLVDPVIRERIVFCVGLVCGHLKSTAFADCFAWQSGIRPGELEEIDFRVKMEGRTAGDYGVFVRGSGGAAVIRPTRSYFGYNWGYNFFRYPACSYCDDVFSETADISVGDAWLPDYERDPKGASVIVVRSPVIQMLVDEAIHDGRLIFKPASTEEVERSQAGGLRDRREGLSYRLYLKQRASQWFPKKRVLPSRDVPVKRRRIYYLRMKMEALSHLAWKEAVEKNRFWVFRKRLAASVRRYNRYYLPWHLRAVLILKKLIRQPLLPFKKLLGKL